MCENSVRGGCKESERRDREKKDRRKEERNKKKAKEERGMDTEERRYRRKNARTREAERRESDHVGGVSAQRLRKTHKQPYYNNGRACCTNTISA